MAGGVRNEGDEKRANDIEALGIGCKKILEDWLKGKFTTNQWKASEYGLENDISVERNISFERMQQLFKTAQVCFWVDIWVEV